jgi:hypothetical protein
MGPDTSAEKVKELRSDFEKAYGAGAKEELKGIMALKAASKFGRRGKTFGEEAGEALGGVADDLTAAKKAENEAKKQLTLAEMDYERAKRAEKRGNFEVGERLADRAENRKEKAYQFNQQKLEKLQEAQIKYKQIESSEKVGMAQVSAQRAGQFNFDKELADAEMQKGIEAYRAAYGRNPTGKELADIRAAAYNKAAELRRFNPYGAPNLDIRTQSEITDAQKEDEILKNLRIKLLTADPKDQPAIETQIENRKAEIARQVQSRIQRAGTQPAAPQQGSAPPRVMGSPLPKTKAELQTGTVYETSRGPARWNGRAFEAIQ